MRKITNFKKYTLIYKSEKSDDLRETLNRLYSCRDLEINNLWQKSILLAPILILCFTGYGILLFELSKEILKGKESQNTIIIFNLLGIIISVISAIFSILWIYTAKASKAWYEFYERTITRFEKQYKDKLGIPSDFIMGNIKYEEIFSHRLFSLKADKLSPSKINILIGQLSLIIWIITFFIHLVVILFYVFSYESICIFFCLFLPYIIYIVVFIMLFFSLLIKRCFRKRIESSYLTMEDKKISLSSSNTD